MQCFKILGASKPNTEAGTALCHGIVDANFQCGQRVTDHNAVSGRNTQRFCVRWTNFNISIFDQFAESRAESTQLFTAKNLLAGNQ